MTTASHSRLDCDVAIVGSGIVGLAHAVAARRRGLSVALVDRADQPRGASVRNFGMVWPIGQPEGRLRARALRSREVWLELASEAGYWIEETGSLHLAYHADEAAVLSELIAGAGPSAAGALELIGPDAVIERAPGVVRAGLLGALWSATEACVDPREATTKLATWLGAAPGVTLLRGVAAVEAGVLAGGGHGVRLATGRVVWAPHVIVCPGEDLETLFPAHFAAAPITRCKLQMMRTAPQPGAWRLGPMLAAGSTLRHYAAFAACPSLAAVRARFTQERPLFDQFGIHVMASQNGLGEVVLGDSHEYGAGFSPDSSAAIDAAILEYAATFLTLPSPSPAARWHGVYAKRTDGGTEQVFQPSPGVRVVAALGGAGMTLSFGLAEEVLDDLLGVVAQPPDAARRAT
ncbi:MAG: TIGR03364 family FAD-dependent oxidoreductase [Planctomycetota bacterium]